MDSWGSPAKPRRTAQLSPDSNAYLLNYELSMQWLFKPLSWDWFVSQWSATGMPRLLYASAVRSFSLPPNIPLGIASSLHSFSFLLISTNVSAIVKMPAWIFLCMHVLCWTLREMTSPLWTHSYWEPWAHSPYCPGRNHQNEKQIRTRLAPNPSRAVPCPRGGVQCLYLIFKILCGLTGCLLSANKLGY